MIDPSLALTDEGIALFEDDEIARQMTVSRAFFELLDDENRWAELEVFGVVPDANVIFRLRRALEPVWVEKFSYAEAEGLSVEAEGIRGALLEDGEPLGEVAADQWAFLVARSWLLDRLRRFLERIRRAGARVIELTSEQMRRLGEFLGNNAKAIANRIKLGGKAVELAIQAGGPSIAAALRNLQIPVDEAELQFIERGAALVVEYDP
jgi:hypothetical protein